MSRRCRDCADNFGTCPLDGTRCDPGMTRAQQDAPTDAEIQSLWSQTATGGVGSLPANLIGFARALLTRYAPAQDAEEDAYVIDRMSKLLAGVAVALKGPEKARHRHGYQDLPELAAQVMAELQKLRQDAERERDAGIEAAAAWVDKRRDDFDREHGHEDPDTGTWEYGTGPHAEAKREYSAELAEIAEGLRTLKSDAARAQRAAAQGERDEN